MKGYERIANQIMNLLRAHPRGLTITDISQTLHLNRNSVAKYLEILVISGHVEKKRVGRAKLFFLSQRIPVSAMLNLSSDMILILDGESRIWYVNDNLLAHAGREQADLIGKTLDEVRIDVFSDPEIRARISNAFEDQEYQKEVFIPREDGGLFFTATLVSTIFEDGSRGITFLIKDISKRKRAEKQLEEHLFFLQELIDRVPTPVFYKDTEGHYLGCNIAFEVYTRRSRDEILGKKALEVVPAELARHFETMDTMALKTGRTQSFESVFPYHDGTKRDFIVFKAPFLNRDGSPGGIVGTIIDIKKRKEAEKALQKRAETPRTGSRKVEKSVQK
jgi:PAS domain S-box-containing protein